MNIPKEWSPEVINKWEDLKRRFEHLWVLEMLEGSDSNIVFQATHRVKTGDDRKLEIVHQPDFYKVKKVCQKIDHLENLLEETKSATA